MRRVTQIAALTLLAASLVAIRCGAWPSHAPTRCPSEGSARADAPSLAISFVDSANGRARVRVGIAAPDGATRGDILYFHGFGDRLDNHGPLFDAWRAAGLRTIAFDFPSHGESCGEGLDAVGIRGLAAIAASVEEATREAQDRPLLVAGWSTGGLVAIRLVEDASFPKLTRRPRAAILIAPAVAVHLVVGDHGFLTRETLTRNEAPPHNGPIAPRTPFLFPAFSIDLQRNAAIARATDFPRDVPALVITGGSATDSYADTEAVEAWVKDQRARGAAITGRACAGGFHELDNEPDGLGEDVRAITARFATRAVATAHQAEEALATATTRCEEYR